MHDEGIEPESVGAVQFIAQRVELVQSQRWRRRSNINEVAVVSDHGPNARLGDAPSKEHHFVIGQGARAPLASRLGEDLERLAFRRDRAIHGARESPGDGEMSTEPGSPPRVVCAVG